MDIPVSILMPAILDIADLSLSPEGAARETWQLLASDGRTLAGSGTLASQGVRPGAMIHLVGQHRFTSVEPELPTHTMKTGPSHTGSWRGFFLPVTPPGTMETRPFPVGRRPDQFSPMASDEQPTDIMEAKLFLVGSGTSGHDHASQSRLAEHSVAPLMPAKDGLSPIQRVDMLLPAPVGTATRLAAGAQALLGRIGWPEQGAAEGTSVGGVSSGTTSAYGGTDITRAPDRWADSVAEPPAGADSPEALDEHDWSTGLLLPADFAVATRQTRVESARRLWRDLGYQTRLEARVTGPRLLRCATIAVVSPKGGVGKTTVTALLGTLFSLLRRDPTVAIDTNPDFGSLGRVLTRDQSWYVDDLARLVAEDDELSLTALDSHLGRAVHGLLVVPAPTDPDRMAALDEGAYRRVITKLKDFFGLILLDCGTGLQDPASAAAIATSDQVLLVTDAQPATASLVAESTRLLYQWGRPITVVVNRMPAKGSNLDLQQLGRHLPGARGLIVIPDDVAAATKLAAGSFDWREAPVGWQRAVRQLAAVLVADWPSLGLSK